MTLTRTELHQKLQLIEVVPGVKFPLATLKEVLPDIEVALFFAKLYKLDVRELNVLLSLLFGKSNVVQALTQEGGQHSNELQDYLVELGYEDLIESGEIDFAPSVSHGEVLPELWKACEVQIAASIQEVADTLKDVVGAMPGKLGEMVFRSLMTVNAKRPVLGNYKAVIHHGPQLPNLVVMDVSGSMSEHTICTIVDDTVALAYLANAHLAIVSNNTTYWQPGEFSTDTVLAAAEYAGTHYETLASLLDQQWGVVVSIADYDSSQGAKDAIAQCQGSIEQLLDVSLVGRPTFLAECLGQLAKDVKPLLVAQYDLV